MLDRFPGPISVERTPIRKVGDRGIAVVLVAAAARYIWVNQSFLSAVVGILVSGFAFAVVRRKTRWILEAKGIRTAYGSFHPWSSIGNFQAWMPSFGLALLSFDRADVSDSFKVKINRWIFRRDDAEIIDPGGLTRLELEELVNSWHKLAAEFD